MNFRSYFHFKWIPERERESESARGRSITSPRRSHAPSSSQRRSQAPAPSIAIRDRELTFAPIAIGAVLHKIAIDTSWDCAVDHDLTKRHGASRDCDRRQCPRQFWSHNRDKHSGGRPRPHEPRLLLAHQSSWLRRPWHQALPRLHRRFLCSFWVYDDSISGFCFKPGIGFEDFWVWFLDLKKEEGLIWGKNTGLGERDRLWGEQRTPVGERKNQLKKWEEREKPNKKIINLSHISSVWWQICEATVQCCIIYKICNIW